MFLFSLLIKVDSKMQNVPCFMTICLILLLLNPHRQISTMGGGNFSIDFIFSFLQQLMMLLERNHNLLKCTEAEGTRQPH